MKVTPHTLTSPAAATGAASRPSNDVVPPQGRSAPSDELAMPQPLVASTAHACRLPAGLTPVRSATPELVAQASSCPADPATEAGAAVCQLHDARKAAWAGALAQAPDRPAAARRLAAMTEALHGKAGQTPNTQRWVRALLADGRVQAQLGPQDVGAQAQHIEEAAALLNLGEVHAQSAHYLVQGRPSDEARASFRQRPERAAQFVAEHGLAGAEVQQLLRAFHKDEPGERPLAAQLLDISERAAAMTAVRPGRTALPVAKVVSILQQEGDRHVFDAALVAVVVDHLQGTSPRGEEATHG